MSRSFGLVLCAVSLWGASVAAPARSLEALQQEFLQWEYGMFIHFNMATFTEREWANGYEDPTAFAPEHLDCGQWADVAREAGMKYAVLTVKHTGGWCLWDSQHTTHDIQAFTRLPGQPRDIVREFVNAFRTRGLKVGFYYCFPGDYDNRAGNTLPPGQPSLHGLPPEAKDRYVEFMRHQLTELLTNYGPVDLIWIDQYANRYTRAQWPELKAHIHSLQPNCIVIANNCHDFALTDIHSYEYPWLRHARPGQELPPSGNTNVAEVCDTITGSDWFWKTSHSEASLKSAQELAEMRLLCRQRRANYLLNVPPDRTGRIPDAFAQRLREAARCYVERQAHPAETTPTIREDLTPWHDARRVLLNPDKGWYHHYPDNHPEKYRIRRPEDLLEFPGMDHIYIRIAWSYLEPREGQFDWSLIDRIIEEWVPRGLGIAFRISCKETSTDRPEQQFATPRWVMEAGAQGGFYRAGKPAGPDAPWEPDYGDPIFLSKLENFLKAFAMRYDGRPYVRYVDIGSIGDWGEGHTWAGSRTEPGFAVRKTHVDLHVRHIRRSQLVVSDDFVYALRNPEERQALHRHIVTNGISYRDDSILVAGYLAGYAHSYTVRSPEFFADVCPERPTVLELEHYGQVKKSGNWDAQPGSELAKHGGGKTGPDFFRGALELLHATYIGYHGDAHEWLQDNPDLTRELLNRCGYWLFPTALERPAELVAGRPASFTLWLENRGVAPPYRPYEVRVRLATAGVQWTTTVAHASRSWSPGAPIEVRWQLTPSTNLPCGRYQLSVGLVATTESGQRPVELALTAERRQPDGFYALTEIELVPPAAP